MNSRILAIDYGERRIGLAISDPMRIIATGLETLTVKSESQAIEQLKRIVAENEVREILIGLPMSLKGTQSAKAAVVMKFSEKLEQATHLPIRFWDERFSTVTAQRLLLQTETKKKRRNKEKIDQLAAIVILRNYLDSSESQNTFSP